MFVCVCYGVRDREVEEAIAMGARSREDLAMMTCGAGTKCGRCVPLIDEMLEKESETACLAQGIYTPDLASA